LNKVKSAERDLLSAQHGTQSSKGIENQNPIHLLTYKPEKEKQMAADMMYTALAGLNTFNTALTVVSDNIANANTTGFKSNTVDFGDLVSGLISTPYASNATAEGAGSTVLGLETDFSTGSEIETGTWSDLMIQGGGFFSVENSAGATEYTRDGSFEVNSAGDLTDMNGNEVLGVGSGGSSAPIVITNPSQYTSFAVSSTGEITGTTATGTVTQLGQVAITTFSNENGLIRVGENDYTAGTNVGTATTGAAGTGQAGTITSGALEGSNVDLTAQMVNLIDYQADYQANSKSITTDSTDLQTVVNLIR
jgi:flagellar hook protein FlgE